MAVKISTESGEVKRGDVFFLNPSDVLVKESLRGRHKPPSDEKVVAMAESILANGQIQAVECRRIEGNRLLLTLGFTRTAAVRLIRKGFTDSAGEFQQDEEFKLKVMVTDCNDKEAFMRNVVENAVRNQTSPIDDMLNQRRMRDDCGMTDAEIARSYGYVSQTRVAQLKKLLALDDATRDTVHDGRLSISAALDLLDAPSEVRQGIVAAASSETGKVNGTKVRSAVRDVINDDDREEDSPQPDVSESGKQPAERPEAKTKPRSVSELRAFLESLKSESEDESVSRFCSDMLRYLSGKTSDRSMKNAITRLLEA